MMKPHTRKLLLTALLLLLASATPTFALNAVGAPEVPKLSSTKLDSGNPYYIIESDADYETFRQIVATGNPYANAILNADITVTKPIGSGDIQFHYRGRFNGRGHTVTLNMADESEGGLFSYTEPGTIIRNLKVTGTASATSSCGSIVAQAYGTTIENCISEATIKGTGISGGIIGVARGECFLENCAYIGELSSTAQQSGLVGKNSHMISIKSCYVDPKCTTTTNTYTDQVTIVETFRNNYSCSGNSNLVNNSARASSLVSKDGVRNGELCYKLNKNGKGGIVWYQHGDYPYPFEGNDGQTVTSTADGYVIGSSQHDHAFTDGICDVCGSLDRSVKQEPLQDSGEDAENNGQIYVGYLRYSLDTDNHTAIVKGLRHATGNVPLETKRDAIAVHIPETINYKGVVYQVCKIGNHAFQNSIMQTCYIPKSITRIECDAFNYCSQLTDLHIADAAAYDGLQKLWMGDCEDTTPDEELFYYSPLETLYIGRNLEWDPTAFNDPPFDARRDLRHIFWGPHVSLVGNNRDGYPYEELNKELFGLSRGIQKVYFMGDDASIDIEPIKIYNGYESMSRVKDFYVNRNFLFDANTKKHIRPQIISNAGMPAIPSEDYIEGLFSYCEKVTFGPLVSYIGEEMFATSQYLKSVDLTNAFRLREIHSHAFKSCGALTGIRLPSFVETVCGNAFDDSKMKHLIIECSDIPLEIIGDGGFSQSLSTVIVDREVINFHANSSIWTIGPNVETLRADEFADRTTKMFIQYSETPLKCEKEMKLKIGELLYLDRDLEGEDGEVAFIKNSRETMDALSFGDNITEIPSGMFRDQQKITFLIIPANITHIGEMAFVSCNSLEVVSILGEPEVDAMAFCYEPQLKYLFLMGNTISLGNFSFYESPNLKEIYTAFYQDPGESSRVAFDDEAYTNVTLTCAGDQDSRCGDVELTSVPWKYWRDNGKQQANFETDIFSYVGSQMNRDGLYDRAILSHNLSANDMELVYLPFDVDSYYFGVDADIYRMPLSANTSSTTYSNTFCAENQDIQKAYSSTINKIDFVKVNLDTEKVLTKDNIYLIKLKDRDEKYLCTHFNLFYNQGISIKNKSWTHAAQDTDHSSPIKCGMWPQSTIKSDADHKYYTTDNGVIKLINGNYPLDISTVIIETNQSETMNFDFQLSTLNSPPPAPEASAEELSTSRSSIPFNENLEGYSTFYAADYHYVAPDWCDVYIVTSTKEGEDVDLVEITDRTITQGQAVLLKSKNDAKVEGGLSECLTFATHGSSCSYDGNLLKGVDKSQTVSELGRDFIYVLGCNSQHSHTGFYKFTADKMMTKGKAYLDPEGLSPKALAKTCLFVCDATVSSIQPAPSADAMQGIYDLMGRRLKEAGYKGIYILNGKKVVIK